MIKIVAATKRHAKQLAKRGLRHQDLVECHALGYGPKAALRNAWEASKHCWTVLDDDERPIGMFGVAAHATDPKLGIPWMLGSDELYFHPREWLKHSKHYVGVMLRYFPKLANIVHAYNLVSISWLKWAGFTVSDEPRQYGPKREPFVVFHLSR